jgi:hypothetical protein
MSNSSSESVTRTKKTFVPKTDNFKVSLKYEGMSLKEDKRHSIEELKRKYAR